MKVEILYTSKSKHVKPIADEMARWVKTYSKDISQFQPDRNIDLLVIGFDDNILKKDKELIDFITKLNRSNIKNIALFNAFYLNDKKIRSIIKLCQQNDLPLMREQYTWKITPKQFKLIDQHVIDTARLYIEDMVTIVRDYY